jgi:hypothetical protein
MTPPSESGGQDRGVKVGSVLLTASPWWIGPSAVPIRRSVTEAPSSMSFSTISL